MKTDAMMMNVCMAFMMLLSASTVQAAKEPYCLQPCKNACYAKKDCDSYKKPIRCTRRCDKKCDKKIAKEGCPAPPCLAPCISACEVDKDCANAKNDKKKATCTKRCTKKCDKKIRRKGCPTSAPTAAPLPAVPACLTGCVSDCETKKDCANAKNAKKQATCSKRCTKKCLKKFKRKGCPKTPKPTSAPTASPSTSPTPAPYTPPPVLGTFACNTVVDSGGTVLQEDYKIVFNGAGPYSGTIEIWYYMYTNPDGMTVFYEGKTIFTTGGLVSGEKTIYKQISGTTNYAIVRMQAPNLGTAWHMRVGCVA